MNVRLRRLRADHGQIEKRFKSSPYIVIRKATGNPPERYEIEYRVRSLLVKDDGEIVESNVHVAEIVLTRGYPRRPPQCKMLTPIFHPNIDPGAICIGDHWAASEALSDLILRIGEIITYQSYNTKSPLNGEAARWADENGHLLPVDPVDLLPPEVEPDAPPAISPPYRASVQADTTGGCQNCGAPAAQATLEFCVNGHLVCPDCALRCEKCGTSTCVLCERAHCQICSATGCSACLKACPSCGNLACPDHFVQCSVCDDWACPKCAQDCSGCERTFCSTHSVACESCGGALCEDCTAHCSICPPDRVHHRTELSECQNCEAHVCSKHIHVSAMSGTAVCDICGTLCESCGEWVTNTEITKCSICRSGTCYNCIKACPLCKQLACSAHTLTCETCGRSICTQCSFTCPTCGTIKCRTKSHVGLCTSCGKPFCVDCLELCAECGEPSCSHHSLACDFCNQYVCTSRPCSEICSSCGALTHSRHVLTCTICSSILCPQCSAICTHCGATTCRTHLVRLSGGKKYCTKCFNRREKMITIIGLSATAAGVALFILFIILLYQAS